MATDAPTEQSYQLGWHVVCLLDLLGQKERLRTWDKVPTDGQLTDEMRQGMRESAGTVLEFYNAFRSHFGVYKGRGLPCPVWHKLSVEQQAAYVRLRDLKLQVQQFSDTFVFHAPLVNDHRELMVVPVYAITAACAMTMLVSLAAGVPLRGAIHIGTGICIPEIGFYGPALADAHYLESEIAQYPRIVVSCRAADFTRNGVDRDLDPLIVALLQQYLRQTEALLFRDRDGQIAVDFLGEGFRQSQMIGEDGVAKASAVDADRFVWSECQRLLRKSQETVVRRDVDLAMRYSVLYEYMAARLPKWGIAPTGLGATKGVGNA